MKKLLLAVFLGTLLIPTVSFARDWDDRFHGGDEHHEFWRRDFDRDFYRDRDRFGRDRFYRDRRDWNDERFEHERRPWSWFEHEWFEHRDRD